MEIRRRPPNPKVRVAHLEYAVPHDQAGTAETFSKKLSGPRTARWMPRGNGFLCRSSSSQID